MNKQLLKKGKTMTKEPKPPFIPRSLCSSFWHWILQIPSPSRFAMYRFSISDPSANKYFTELDKYKIDLILWKINNRTCTRQEWHFYRRNLKREEP